MLTLAAPWWLAALPVLLGATWLRKRRQPPPRASATALLHPQTALLMQLSQQVAKPPLPWWWLAGCALLLFALARPQWSGDPQHQGRNFLLAVDVSSSMKAQDFEEQGRLISRLEMVKRVVDSFVRQRQGDRIGLLIFADDAFTLAPLTTDQALLRHHLNTLNNGMAGQRTALGNAIALGVKRLQSQDERSRSLILLTDGSNTAGNIHPLNALQLAQHNGVRIYSVGIGSDNQVMFPRGPAQSPDFAHVPMDEALLQRLATDSGGQYYRASAPGDLERIIDDIETLETIPLERQLTRPQEWYHLPLGLGLALLLFQRWRARREVLPC